MSRRRTLLGSTASRASTSSASRARVTASSLNNRTLTSDAASKAVPKATDGSPRSTLRIVFSDTPTRSASSATVHMCSRLPSVILRPNRQATSAAIQPQGFLNLTPTVHVHTAQHTPARAVLTRVPRLSARRSKLTGTCVKKVPVTAKIRALLLQKCLFTRFDG